MTIEAAEYLISEEGSKLLQNLSYVNEAQANYYLLNNSGKSFIAEIITLVLLRKKAETKFSKAAEMYFTREGLEQATNEKLSEYLVDQLSARASVSTVVDIGCGNGGNLLSFAKKFNVIAIDSDPVHLIFAKANARVYGVEGKVTFINTTAEDFLKASQASDETTVYFLDPQRMREGTTKTRSLFNATPRIGDLLPLIFKISQKVFIKISPAFDYDEISELPDIPEIEIISEDNVNKLAILWFKDLKKAIRRATCVVKDQIFVFENEKEPDGPVASIVESLEAGGYIFEPNVAITKAHLLNTVALRLHMQRLNDKIGFLVSKELPDSKFRKIFRAFKIVETFSSLGNLKKRMTELAITHADITSRGFYVKPDDIRKKLKIKEGGEYIVISTMLKNKEPVHLLTTKIVS